MKSGLLMSATASLVLSGSAFGADAEVPADASKIKVTRVGVQPPREGPAEYFTGSVRVDPLYETGDGTNKSAAFVTFQPGARSAWHTHPNGQTLIVTAGVGRVQRWDDSIEEIRAGDVVWIPPRQKHWHGASPASSMTHIALQEAVEGKNVIWMEKVTDEQYLVNPGAQKSQSTDDLRSVSPALASYTKDHLHGGVWNRPGLSKRDRSLVTITALIARRQAEALGDHLEQALEFGVKPGEISEVITHLAFYSGWENARAAVEAAKPVFHHHGIGPDRLPSVAGDRLPLDEKAEAQRSANVSDLFGAVAPGLVEYTTDVLFLDLWLRPGLAPRDRSLITVAALISSGQVAQIPFHLNRAMDHGFTQTEAAEVITHLAFYAGWPNAFSALPVAKEVFGKRAQ